MRGATTCRPQAKRRASSAAVLALDAVLGAEAVDVRVELGRREAQAHQGGS
jgi:hypothetical protein